MLSAYRLASLCRSSPLEPLKSKPLKSFFKTLYFLSHAMHLSTLMATSTSLEKLEQFMMVVTGALILVCWPSSNFLHYQYSMFDLVLPKKSIVFVYTWESNMKNFTQWGLSIYVRMRYVVSIMQAMIMINDSLRRFRWRHT